MRKLITLLFCLSIFHPGFAASTPDIEGYFTDTTNTVSSKSDIIQRAERFKKQTGIAPFILLTTQETLLQAKKHNYCNRQNDWLTKIRASCC